MISSDEDEVESTVFGSLPARPRLTFSETPSALTHSDIAAAVSASKEPLAVQKLQAELEVAEAELKSARLRHQYIQAKEAAERDAASRAA